MKGITPDDAVSKRFIAQWSLRSDKQRIKDEIERRKKNESLTSYRIDDAIEKYKKETGWYD